MQIRKTPPVSFKGYDARRLKALCLTFNKNNIADELAEVGQKVGFDVFVASDKSLVRPQMLKLKDFRWIVCDPWAQDIAAFTPENKIVSACKNYNYLKVLGAFFDKEPKLELITPQGGNFFYVKDTDGKDIVLSGKSNKGYMFHSTEIKDIYGVDKVDYIPQMDFHIDLFLRPLDNKKVLIADDNMTVNLLKKGVDIFAKLKENSGLNFLDKSVYSRILKKLNKALESFEDAIRTNRFAKLDETEAVLKEKGYKVFRVPGRIYNIEFDKSDLKHELNYMNAIVTKDKNDKMVYITNKSLFDVSVGITPRIAERTGFSFEKEFVNILSNFVPKENIYFVSGKNDEIHWLLKKRSGGIHCLVTEVPE